jgi:hypothetical protein
MTDVQELNLSLNEFISSPKSVDIISDAIAVCAPWAALTRYKHKVKLTPGSTKKGKAARSIMGGFLAMPVDEKGEDPEKMSPREKELLASLKCKRSLILCLILQTRILFSAFGQKLLKFLEERRNLAKEERNWPPQRERERNNMVTYSGLEGDLHSMLTEWSILWDFDSLELFVPLSDFDWKGSLSPQ